jgi:hypothetical protein
MGQSNKPIQFRTLPRSNEKESSLKTKSSPGTAASKAEVIAQKRWAKPKNPMLRNYLIVGAALIAAFAILFNDPRPVEKASASKANKVKVRPDDNSPEALVNRYLQDADARREMAMKNRELENRASARPLGADAAVIPENDRQLGVTLDQENSAEKVYKDLYGHQDNHGPVSPEDRISMRLQEDQWLAQTEKQERKQYIQNFLKEAYDAGYAIDLDENLVVVRVKKVTSRPKESLDKVLENLARKGY